MRKDFFGITIRQIKRNFQCARCKKEHCPLRYKHDVLMDGCRVVCDKDFASDIDKFLKVKKRKSRKYKF